ncbi:hypothetical protein IB238_05525 [Rhizobium sp. ARZ01]|uniref:hypothetical protein n=1 Tax=Rhizobium sp. ARZ01 TaxID=2769313 RepID=UPI001782D153|nr:hypothetical protein [Rhizobium sp. ARZ01]MBD9372089.1 hypothetical protein [Rhizobium sp. ARZ01]
MDEEVCDCCERSGPTMVCGRKSGQDADPLMVSIAAYRLALLDFVENAPDDDKGRDTYAATSYEPPRQRIADWRMPARCRAAAIAALRLAVDAEQEGDYALVGPMIGSALGFLESVDVR